MRKYQLWRTASHPSSSEAFFYSFPACPYRPRPWRLNSETVLVNRKNGNFFQPIKTLFFDGTSEMWSSVFLKGFPQSHVLSTHVSRGTFMHHLPQIVETIVSNCLFFLSNNKFIVIVGNKVLNTKLIDNFPDGNFFTKNSGESFG